MKPPRKLTPAERAEAIDRDRKFLADTRAMHEEVRADIDEFFAENPDVVAAWRESIREAGLD